MIETEYHAIPANVYQEIESEAIRLNVSIDYFLMEFCSVSEEE